MTAILTLEKYEDFGLHEKGREYIKRKNAGGTMPLESEFMEIKESLLRLNQKVGELRRCL